MNLNPLIDRLLSACKGISFRINEPLSAHTSFRIGGPAAVMAFPKTPNELKTVLLAAKSLSVPVRLLGAGSNVLAPDKGVQALVICTKDALMGLRMISDDTFEAMAGETLAHAAVFAREHALTGMEFAHGIPGTVGGGVYMNAGAYGGELKQICQSVTALMPSGEIETFTGEDLFGYRTSVFQTNGAIILKAVFRLSSGDGAEIAEKMRELMQRRTASQPLELPSAGSTFKRPVGGFAGTLIEASGLKGKGSGGAQVSTKHAGFVVNVGGATAKDVLDTIRLVQTTVQRDSGFFLEPEVRIW